ncbi:ATP-binding protein [Streptomyces resistomycificus]|nr:ATP-binding protein [Streptomyces resistomycificus]
MSRKPWELAFTAKPAEVAALRRLMRLHLGIWGLHEVVEEAQLCVSELVSNVITHVGPDTPTTLVVSMRGTQLRIEVHDPNTRTVPTKISADADAEAGRGMLLIDALAQRWGVQLFPDHKVTWCELATNLTTPHGHSGSPQVERAERVLNAYRAHEPTKQAGGSRLTAAVTETVAVGIIADLLHWLRAHGHDADEALDRAQTHFEAEAEALTTLRC